MEEHEALFRKLLNVLKNENIFKRIFLRVDMLSENLKK